MRSALALAAMLLAGCSLRAAPYRFSAPFVGAARLDEAPPHRYHAPPVSPAEVRTEARTEGPELGGAFADVNRREVSVTVTELEDVRNPDDLRAMTGVRDDRAPVAFAIDAAVQLGANALTADDGPALVALAQDLCVLADPTAAVRPGDLLVFDRAVDGQPASLVAVAIARDDRGVIEMIYLARGVVRRGFCDPARPTVHRDGDGRIVNTFLRHTKDYPPKGTRFLAGELLAHVVRW